MARPTGVPMMGSSGNAMGTIAGNVAGGGCNCGGAKPTQGTTPPGQPPVSMRPNDAIPYPGSPSMRPYTGTMPQIMPESRPYPSPSRSLFGGGAFPTPQHAMLPNGQIDPRFLQATDVGSNQAGNGMSSLFDMVKARMF